MACLRSRMYVPEGAAVAFVGGKLVGCRLRRVRVLEVSRCPSGNRDGRGSGDGVAALSWARRPTLPAPSGGGGGEGGGAGSRFFSSRLLGAQIDTGGSSFNVGCPCLLGSMTAQWRKLCVLSRFPCASFVGCVPCPESNSTMAPFRAFPPFDASLYTMPCVRGRLSPQLCPPNENGLGAAGLEH